MPEGKARPILTLPLPELRGPRASQAYRWSPEGRRDGRGLALCNALPLRQIVDLPYLKGSIPRRLRARSIAIRRRSRPGVRKSPVLHWNRCCW